MIDWVRFEKELSKHPADQQRKIMRGLLKAHYNENFSDYCHLLGYGDVNPHTHADVIEVLVSPHHRKLIVMPRGTLKSTITCVAWPHWLLNRNPNLRILIDSEVYTNSKNFLREIKGNMERPEITDIFGVYKSRTWNEGEMIIKQRTANSKEANITCGGVGTVKVGQHYEVIIHDDLNSPKNSSSPEKCKKIIDHYKMNTSVLEPEGIVAIVATRYSELDVVGHVLANEVFPKEDAGM